MKFEGLICSLLTLCFVYSTDSSPIPLQSLMPEFITHLGYNFNAVTPTIDSTAILITNNGILKAYTSMLHEFFASRVKPGWIMDSTNVNASYKDSIIRKYSTVATFVVTSVETECGHELSILTTSLTSLMPFGQSNNNLHLFVTTKKCQENTLQSETLQWSLKYKAIVIDHDKFRTNTNRWCLGFPRSSELDICPDMATSLNGRIVPISLATRIPGIQTRVVGGNLMVFKTGGHHLPCLLETARRLNFTLTFFKSTGGGTTGLQLPNGTWTGVVGDVLYDRAKIGMASLITLDRYLVVHSLSSVDYLSVILVTARPREAVSWSFILWPFSSTLWYFVAASAAIIVMITWFMVKHAQSRGSWYANECWHITDIVMSLMGCCLNQGTEKLRKITYEAVRMLIIYWSFFAIVMSTAYASRLFALYMNAPLEKVPETFHELAESDFNIGMSYYGGALYNLLERSHPKSAGIKIFNRVKKMRPIDCIESAKNFKFACITYDLDVLMYLNTRPHSERHLFRLGQETLVQLAASGVVARSSILKESMDKAFSKIADAGLVSHWRRQTFYDLHVERRSTGDIGKGIRQDKAVLHKSLGIKELSGVTMTFLAGLVAAFVIFVVESSLHLFLQVICRYSNKIAIDIHKRKDLARVITDPVLSAWPVIKTTTIIFKRQLSR